MGKSEAGHILIIDDDKKLVEILAIKLGLLKFQVATATSALTGHKLALKHNYDLIVLDIMMPVRSGLEICTDLRANGVTSPILVLSGKIDKASIVKCLEAGADDYLTKPFVHGELAARINALLRRNKRAFPAQLIVREGLELDVVSRLAKADHSQVRLTKTEAQLLFKLMNSAPEAVPKKDLLNDVWGVGQNHSSNRLEVYAKRLRTKLEGLSGHNYVHNLRGSGYYFQKISTHH